jgi:RHS repeat-associated protein
VHLVSDYQGRVYEHIEYTPYGELWVEHGPEGLEAVPYRFTGKELDEETGLYYYGARYLNPRTSRWISADPAGPRLMDPKRQGYSIVEATNWYSYASNNPLKYSDPTGLSGIAEEEESSHPMKLWEIEYEAYRQSVEAQIRPRTAEQEEEFYQGVERGIVGVSDQEFEARKQRWFEAHEQLVTQRGEIQSLLNKLYHTMARAEGIKEEAEVKLTPVVFAGAIEASQTGEPRTLAEASVEAKYYASEYLAERSAEKTIRGSIAAGLSEYAALREIRDIAQSAYISEYKRRRFIRGD